MNTYRVTVIADKKITVSGPAKSPLDAINKALATLSAAGKATKQVIEVAII